MYAELKQKICSKCAVCSVSVKTKAHIDHCHTTEKIRGLLCVRCNLGLGYFQDRILNLTNATTYLMKFKK